MSLNVSFDRWVKASLADHFSSLPHHLHVDGKHRETEELTTWYELRIVSINKKELVRDVWEVMVDLDLACLAIHENNAYTVDDLAGAGSAAMGRCIRFFQYDEELADPVTELRPFEREQDPVSEALGEVKPGLKLYQTNITASYKVFI